MCLGGPQGQMGAGWQGGENGGVARGDMGIQCILWHHGLGLPYLQDV